MTTESSKNGSGETGRSRRVKTFLSPSAKYEIYLQLVRGETTIAQAATAARVDRSTILRIRTVGKEAALAALAASKPGVGKSARDMVSIQRREGHPVLTLGASGIASRGQW